MLFYLLVCDNKLNNVIVGSFGFRSAGRVPPFYPKHGRDYIHVYNSLKQLSANYTLQFNESSAVLPHMHATGTKLLYIYIYTLASFHDCLFQLSLMLCVCFFPTITDRDAPRIPKNVRFVICVRWKSFVFFDSTTSRSLAK